MITKIIKNNTQQLKTWVGQRINVSGSYTIQPEEEVQWMNDGVLELAIESGDAIVNDGEQDIVDVSGALIHLRYIDDASNVKVNSDSPMVVDNVGEALNELHGLVTSGILEHTYNFSRKGTSSAIKYMLVNDEIASNLSGHVMVAGGNKVVVGASCTDNATGDITFEKRIGPNLSGLFTMSLTSERKNSQVFTQEISEGDEIAAKISSGSFNNLVVDFMVKN